MQAGELSALIRNGTEAFNAGDHDGVLRLLTEDVEWKRVDGLPDEGGVIRGREAVRAFLEPEVFDRARFETLEVVEEGDTALVRGVFHARGVGSQIELGIETFIVYRLRDGLACRVETWRTREDAERSAGLSLRAP